MAGGLHERLGNISLTEINAMRCEMACAATSMSYLPAHPLDAPAAALARAPPYVPPATCAADAVTNATGLAASLIELLDRRKRVPEGTIYGRLNVPSQFIVPRPPEPEHVPPTFVPPTLPNVYIY